jgi:hypothetical protein
MLREQEIDDRSRRPPRGTAAFGVNECLEQDASLA